MTLTEYNQNICKDIMKTMKEMASITGWLLLDELIYVPSSVKLVREYDDGSWLTYNLLYFPQPDNTNVFRTDVYGTCGNKVNYGRAKLLRNIPRIVKISTKYIESCSLVSKDVRNQLQELYDEVKPRETASITRLFREAIGCSMADRIEKDPFNFINEKEWNGEWVDTIAACYAKELIK